MSRNDDAALLYPLADAFGADLIFQGNNKLAGSLTVEHKMFEGLDSTFTFRVKDALTDFYAQVSGITVQVMPNLFVVLLYELRARTMTAFVLRASALPKKNKKMTVFPPDWSRQQFYQNIAPALVATYRLTEMGKWVQLTVGNELVLEYLAERNRGNKSASAIRKVEEAAGVEGVL